jgi:hypothetical protein
MGLLIFIVSIWLLLSWLVGKSWAKKGRGFAGGFVISLLISPLVAWVIGLVLAPVKVIYVDSDKHNDG